MTSPGHAALLDCDGIVLSVNRAWRAFGLARGASATAGLGSNYLEVCDRASAQGEPDAAHAAALIRAVLAGDTCGEQLTYPCGDDTEQRWFRLHATALPGRHSGAVVVHTSTSTSTDVGTSSQHGPAPGGRLVGVHHLGADRRSASAARMLVAEALSGLPRESVDRAQLLVSELVTNAAVHGAGDIELTVVTDHTWVTVAVLDASAAPPSTHGPTVDAEHGRGLLIVQALAAAWGWDRVAGGKRVWARLPSHPTLALAAHADEAR